MSLSLSSILNSGILVGNTGRETEGEKRAREAGGGEGKDGSTEPPGTPGAQFLLQVSIINFVTRYYHFLTGERAGR